MSSFNCLLIEDDSEQVEITKPLSKKALKKLKRKENLNQVIVQQENDLKKLYENEGIWFSIYEYFNFKEIMLVFSLVSKRDLSIVDSYWCQSFLLFRAMEQFHTLTSKDCNTILNSFDHKRYFVKLRQYQKQAKRKKPEIENTIDTNLERKKTFKKLYQKLWEENNNRVLTLHNTNQAIRSEIQAEFQSLRAVWTSIKSHQFECFHDEFEIEDSITDEEKGKLFNSNSEGYFRFTCKKCGIVAISNFMPVFTGAKFFMIVLILVASFSTCSSNNNHNEIPNQQDQPSSSSNNHKTEEPIKGSFWSLSLKNKLLKYANTVQSGFQKVLSSPLVEKIKGKSKKLSEHSKNLVQTLKNKSKQAFNKSKDMVKEQINKLKQSKPAQKIKKLSKKALRKLMDHLDLIPPSEKNSKDEDDEDRSVVSPSTMVIN